MLSGDIEQGEELPLCIAPNPDNREKLCFVTRNVVGKNEYKLKYKKMDGQVTEFQSTHFVFVTNYQILMDVLNRNANGQEVFGVSGQQFIHIVENGNRVGTLVGKSKEDCAQDFLSFVFIENEDGSLNDSGQVYELYNELYNELADYTFTFTRGSGEIDLLVTFHEREIYRNQYKEKQFDKRQSRAEGALHSGINNVPGENSRPDTAELVAGSAVTSFEASPPPYDPQDPRLKAEVENLKSQLAAKESEFTKMVGSHKEKSDQQIQENENLKSQLTAKESEITKMAGSHKEKSDQQIQENENLKSQLAAKESEILDLVRTSEELQGQLNQTIRRLQAENTTIQEDKTESEKACDRKIKSMRNDLEWEIDELKKKNKRLQTKVDEFVAENTRISEKAETYQKHLSEVKNNENSLKLKLTSLQQKLDETVIQMDGAISQQSHIHSQRVNDLESQIERLKGEHETLSEYYKGHQDRAIGELRQQLETMAKENENLNLKYHEQVQNREHQQAVAGQQSNKIPSADIVGEYKEYFARKGNEVYMGKSIPEMWERFPVMQAKMIDTLKLHTQKCVDKGESISNICCNREGMVRAGRSSIEQCIDKGAGAKTNSFYHLKAFHVDP